MRFPLTLASFLLFALGAAAAPPSHPPLRSIPDSPARPLAAGGHAYYADAEAGSDRNDGSKKAPWQTIAHALTRLKAGDTLYLHGRFYENVHLALHGRPDAPITLRSVPGTYAILDGGFREFFESPAEAWEPYAKGGKDEYRSRQTFPNLRDVLGSFGDSHIGLQTYYHARDLRATSEVVDWEDWNRQAETDIKPLYCGPGTWYDPDSGRIHIRLAHTHLPGPAPNYRGPTDPRTVPLLLTPFQAVALHLDGARNIRLQDLILRGGGYTTVLLDQVDGVEFDNVTVWCGTYGIRAAGTRNLRFFHSALHGNVAPWTFRGDGSKRDYPGRPHRNLSRLNTHALIEIDSGRESSVYATPQNDNWEIAHSDFTDAHDAVYLGAINVRFHHNLIENMQDDGIYLSPMYTRHRLDKKDPEIHISENVFRGVLTALAFGGTEPVTRDRVFVYRNLFDLRAAVPTGRPTARQARAGYSTGKVVGDHGSPPWAAMNLYHNTFVMAEPARQADMATLGGVRAGNPRRVFNNVFLHLTRLPAYAGPDGTTDVAEDGNLFWFPGADRKAVEAFFRRYRSSEAFAKSKTHYASGSSTNSRTADPLFHGVNDCRLTEGSAAVDAGVELPRDWPDPLREKDRGKPDVGALPLGADGLRAGRTSAPGSR